jgi:hypothetical protein
MFTMHLQRSCCCTWWCYAGKQARGAAWQRKILLDLQDETAFSSTELQVRSSLTGKACFDQHVAAA